jgi:hypothetical protein
MGKTIGYVFLAVSIILFLFLVGWSGYRIDTARKANSTSASAESSQLLEQIKSLRDSSGGFDSPYFKDKAHEMFAAQPRLLVLAVYSQSEGISYLITRNRSYVIEPQELTPDWRGTPIYKVSRGFEELFALPFPSPESSMNLDALFVVFGKEDLFPILRDDLYVLFAFLITCGILILFSFGLKEDRREEKNGVPASLHPVPIVQGNGPLHLPPHSEHSATPPVPPAAAASHTESRGPAEGSGPEKSKSMESPESGLVWAEYFEPRLRYEIERAASSDEDLSVARIEMDLPVISPSVYRATALLLRETFPLHDLMFEGGTRGFNLILPDMDIDQAVSALENLRALAERTPLAGVKSTLSIGVSARSGRLVENSTLREEAMVSASKAFREGGNRVYGFRADPSKFRGVLSGLEG